MNKLGSRPEDFYGPDDWYVGLNVDRKMQEIAMLQKAWDEAYAELPLWRRLTGFY